MPDDELTLWTPSTASEETRVSPPLMEGATSIVPSERDTAPPPESHTGRPTEARSGLGGLDQVHTGERYEEVGSLGRGGMAEVRRAHDRLLGRTVAIKILRADRAGDPGLRARFVHEARITGQLQHPNIPAVYDAGILPDGRPWFALEEVRGETLASAMLALQDAGGATSLEGAARLRHLVEAVRSVASAIEFAHERGVIHRDLKPSNVMLGAHAQVLLMDWGIARSGGEVDFAAVDPTEVPEPGSDHTEVGTLLGTRGYMAPEQEHGPVGPAADVYALGMVLAQLCTMARTGSRDDTLQPLRQLARAATGGDPGERPSAAQMVKRLTAWLDGSARREEALRLVREALALSPRIDDHRREAQALDDAAGAMLLDAPGFLPVESRLPAWRKQDTARSLRREADLLAVQREQLLHGALERAPDLEEANRAWADLLRAEHEAAEARGDEDAARVVEARLRGHVEALPLAARVPYVTWLDGTGAVTLVTDPPGARVALSRWEEHDRRLVEVPVRELGATPLVRLPLARGSYVLHLSAAGREPVRYPVRIGRAEHWDGLPPEGGAAEVICLPTAGSLGDARYVPAGWFRCGGDREALHSLPAQRVWVDGFVMDRDPVTNREWMGFLDALVAAGREADAMRCVPRSRGSRAGEEPLPIFGRGADGKFVPLADADGDVWEPEWPVILVDQFAAWTYANWRSARDGLPWRVPSEYEWEKAARGVDGRAWPWGDACDPAWTNLGESHRRAHIVGVDAFPLDVSPYGIRGLGGNVRDWCGNVFFARRGPVAGGRAPTPLTSAPPAGTWAPARGGYWNGPARSARSAARYSQLVELKNETIGVRLVRSV